MAASDHANATATLARRYGTPAAVAGGWAAIPNVVLQTHRALGVTGTHWELCEAIWLDWRSGDPPHIALTTLAERLDVSERTVERYTAALEATGLLHVERSRWSRGHRQLNAYDLRPLIAAALAYAGPAVAADLPVSDGEIDDMSVDAEPTTRCHVSKNAYQDQKTITREISKRARPGSQTAMCSSRPEPAPINAPPPRGGEKPASPASHPPARRDTLPPPAPRLAPPAADAPAPPASFSPARGRVDRDEERTTPPNINAEVASTVQLPLDPDDQALVGPVRALIYELGDDAPASSLTRAQNLRREAGLSAGQFLRVLDEATARTRARQEGIRKRRRDGQTRNGMPYLFAVLQDLLAPPEERRLARGRQPGRARYEEARRTALVETWGTYPEPPPADMPAAWRDTLDELRSRMVAAHYARWLRPTCVLEQTGTTLRIGAPDGFHAQWLDRRMRSLIERAMAQTAPGLGVEFLALSAEVPPAAETGDDAR